MLADKPKTSANTEYHTHTPPGSVAPIVLIGGAPGRMKEMAKKHLKKYKVYRNDKRGIYTATGYYKGLLITFATSGMGVPSLGIILPELIRCGGRIFIRIGSCGSLDEDAKPGDVIIVDHARMWDGVSSKWVPLLLRIFYKVFGISANQHVVTALERAGRRIKPHPYAVHLGTEGTTSDFNTGQSRPGLFGEVPWHLKLRHWICVHTAFIDCYSMEMAGLLAYCRFKAGGLPAGGIQAIFANRVTNEFATEGEDLAARVALEASVTLYDEPALQGYISRELPVYVS